MITCADINETPGNTVLVDHHAVLVRPFALEIGYGFFLMLGVFSDVYDIHDIRSLCFGPVRALCGEGE